VKIFNRILNAFSRRSDILPVGSSRAVRGRYGEDMAERFCKKDLSYRVLARNWRHKKDELDLICLDNEVLVFIEVRARAKEALVSGYASVNTHKKKVLQRACKNYLKQLQNPPKHFRFDVIDVTLIEGQRGEVRHYTNVPLFHKHYLPN
jgi:putative endonuclease